jgi:hypothetical protein
MASIDAGPTSQHGRDVTTNQRSEAAGTTRQPTTRQPKLLTSTEARRSFITSEFWLALVMAIALVVVGYADDDGLAIDQAWALSAGVISFYLLSRGIAKAGSREPQVRDLDDLG